MINIEFNKAVKDLGAKWDRTQWVPPKLAKKEFDILDQKFNQNLVPVELTITDGNRDQGAWLGTAHCIAMCGYVFARAYGRDGGAKVDSEIAILSGGFTSGGSMRNYRCLLKGGEPVRVRAMVAKDMVPELAAREGTDLVLLDEVGDEH